jgi:hypothetical protein
MESPYKKKSIIKHKPRPFKKLIEEQKNGKPMDIDKVEDYKMDIDNPINYIII